MSNANKSRVQRERERENKKEERNDVKNIVPA